MCAPPLPQQRCHPAVTLGQHGIVPNYFEQNPAQALDPRLTVLEMLVRCVPGRGGGGPWAALRVL